MTRNLLLLAICLLPTTSHVAALQPPNGTTTVILVRHAERVQGEGDVAISDRGRERANALARLLVDADVHAIITSQLLRTQQTADPIAKLKAIKPVVLPADNLDAVVERIRSMKSGTVLVVHHSNTVPALVEKLGGKTPPIQDDEFDRLILLTIPSTGSPSVVTLRYGGSSPM